MCGGDLSIQPGMTVAECLYCGSKQTIPNISDEKKATLYDRAGYYRRNNDYDKAMSIYEQLIAEDNTDAEAHWSAVLCRYGIEYVEDPRSHRRIPTVNRAQYKSILNDPDYQSALRNADSSQYDLYQQEAMLIDQIQRGILEVSRREEPFDIFICYKETDNQGRRTQDSVIAYEIYKELTKEGYRVFFARVTLEDKLGTAYEPYIFAALNSAKIMLAVGTNPENFQAVWVKNEWGRYLALMQESDNKTLIPVYKDMNPYDMPEEFSYLQSQDYGKLGAMQDIVRGIGKILGKYNGNDTNSANKITSANGAVSNIEALLKRAYQFIEEGKWEEAKTYYNRVLDIDPESSSAYLIAAMVDSKSKDRQGLIEWYEEIEKNENFVKAIKYGQSEDKKYLYEIIKDAKNYKDEKKFNKATELMQIGGENKLKEALKILKELDKDYDMTKEITECNRKLNEFARRNKHRVIITSVITSIILASLCLIGVCRNYVMPKIKYDQGIHCMSNGNYDEAITIFNKLDDYKDSKEQCVIAQEALQKQKMEMLSQAVKDGNIEKAKTILGDVENMDASIIENYLNAIQEYNCKNYDKALLLFCQNVNYFDSKEYIYQILNVVSARNNTTVYALPGQKEGGKSGEHKPTNYLQVVQAYKKISGYKDADELLDSYINYWNDVSNKELESENGIESDNETFLKEISKYDKCDDIKVELRLTRSTYETNSATEFYIGEYIYMHFSIMDNQTGLVSIRPEVVYPNGKILKFREYVDYDLNTDMFNMVHGEFYGIDAFEPGNYQFRVIDSRRNLLIDAKDFSIK